MPVTIVPAPIQRTGLYAVTAYQTLSVTGATDWVQFQDTNIIVQIDGAATDIVAVVERSALDPSKYTDATWAPADDLPITGDPSSGLSPFVYIELGVAFWRVRVTTLTGGTATVSLSGKSAPPGKGN